MVVAAILFLYLAIIFQPSFAAAQVNHVVPLIVFHNNIAEVVTH